jgi:hypothetical protein
MMKAIDVVMHTPNQKHTHAHTKTKPPLKLTPPPPPPYSSSPQEQGGVSHNGLAIYIKKGSSRQKKNYGNSKYFNMQIYNLQKKILQKNLSRYYYNSIITNLKFQHKPKYHLSKYSY